MGISCFLFVRVRDKQRLIGLAPCWRRGCLCSCSCGNGEGQVEKAVSYLQSNKVRFTKFWLDIEGPGTYWSSDQAKNQAFFESLKAGIKKTGTAVSWVSTSARSFMCGFGVWVRRGCGCGFLVAEGG